MQQSLKLFVHQVWGRLCPAITPIANCAQILFLSDWFSAGLMAPLCVLRSTIHKGTLTLSLLSALVPLVILGRTRSYQHLASSPEEQTGRFIKAYELLTPSGRLVV